MTATSRLAVAAVAVGLWSARCSSSSGDRGVGNTLPDAGPVAPVDAGSGGGVDAGSGGGGGGLDAGSGGGGDTPDAGSGGGTPDAGTGGDGGDTPDAGTGGGSGGGETPDAGTDAGGGTPDAGAGGGVAAGCEDMMPAALGTSVTAGITPTADDQECWAGTSDENGNVAMEAHRSSANPTLTSANSSRSIVHWFQFRRDGSRVGDAFASYGFFPQGSGFIGTWWDGGPPKEYLRYWSGDGQIHDNRAEHFGSDDVPGIMARAFRAGANTATVSDSGFPLAFLTFRRFDATGNLEVFIQKTIPTRGAVIGLAEAAAFARPTVAFITSGSGNLYAYWVLLDPPPSGGPQGEEKLVATGVDPDTFVAHPLRDGRVAVRINGAWAGVLSEFQTTLAPAPAWLADHPDHDFAMIRGERGYALTQSGRNSIEVISNQGNSCGSITFPGVGGVSTGADGTVIGASGPGGCTKKWWPGLLR